MMESLPMEIRRMIMNHLSNAELLELSVVNKNFNKEARRLFRDRANVIAKVSCQNVLPFLSRLKGMNVVHFSGIDIACYATYHRSFCPRSVKIFGPNDLDVLDRMPLKSISLKFFAELSIVYKCPVIQLVSKILQDYSGVLDELQVNDRFLLLEFILGMIRDNDSLLFPRLKILKVFNWRGRKKNGKGIQEAIIKEVKARAPNLQEIRL